MNTHKPRVQRESLNSINKGKSNYDHQTDDKGSCMNFRAQDKILRNADYTSNHFLRKIKPDRKEVG